MNGFMGEMKWILLTVLLGFLIALLLVIVAMEMVQIDLLISRYPKTSFAMWIIGTLILLYWRVRVTYPEWRVKERMDWLIRKIKSKL